MIHLIEAGAGPGRRQAPPHSLDPALVEAAAEDGVHVGALVRAVEHDLVPAVPQLPHLGAVPSLHVLARHKLNIELVGAFSVIV